MNKLVYERQIMWGDLDALGIVFYPRFYEWMDANGHLFFESIDVCLGDLLQERKLIFGLVETSCRYHKPGRYHQKINIITHIQNLASKVIVLKHSIVNKSDNDLIAEGIENRICLSVRNPEHMVAVKIPEDIFSILESAIGHHKSGKNLSHK